VSQRRTSLPASVAAVVLAAITVLLVAACTSSPRPAQADAPRPAQADATASHPADSRSVSDPAAPSATTSPPGPLYARPQDVCRLVRAATLATYLPDAGRGTSDQSKAVTLQNCTWAGTSGGLVVEVSVWGTATIARAFYDASGPINDQNGDGVTVTATQPVTGVGRQATAVFQTITPGAIRSVLLFAWSGDATIEISYQPRGTAAPTARTRLTAAVTIAREVLTALPRQPVLSR
jgi:hypothetical protein